MCLVMCGSFDDKKYSMKLIDYLFYVIESKHKGSSCWDSRSISGSLLVLWLSGFTNLFLSSAGLIVDNPISEVLKKPNDVLSFFFLMPYILVLYAIIYFRYVHKEARYLKIVEWRNGFSQSKRRLFNFLSLLFFIGTPIASFVTFRLYVFGYVWWF